MSNRGALWGEVIAHHVTRAQANAEIARGNQELDRAEAYHRGTVAQLAAALGALREVAPEHPFLQQAVLDVIYCDGSRTANFAAAWELGHDPKQILTNLLKDRAAAVATLLPLVEQEQISDRAGGFLWLSTHYFWWGDRYKTRQSAEDTRRWVLRSLRTGTINDPHDPDGLKRAAWSALGIG